MPVDRRNAMKRFATATAAVAAVLWGSVVAAQDATVNFLGSNAPDWYAPVIKAFEAANPGVRIAYQQVPFDDLNAAIESRIGQGDRSIDLFTADTPRIPAMASRGFLLKLDDRRAAIEAATPNAVDIEQVSFDGSIFAYPMWSSTQLLYYNRAHLAAAGLAQPGADPAGRLTWAALLDMARASQKAGAKYGLIFQQTDRYYQLQPLFESMGAGPGLTGPGLLSPAITTEGWIETAKWYGAVHESGVAPRGISPAQMNDLFINGEATFMVGGPWVLKRFLDAAGLDFGVTLHPQFAEGKPVTPTGAWALGINPNGANRDAAMRFAEFVTLDGEGAYLSIAMAPFPPTNASARARYIEALRAMAPRIGPVDLISEHELSTTAVGRPRTTGYVTFETIMNQAFSDIRNGSDAAATLRAAEAQLARALARR